LKGKKFLGGKKMSDKKVELNAENLEGVAGGVGDVNVKTKGKVGTTVSGNKSDSKSVSNQGSTTNTTSGNLTNTNEGSTQKIGQQGDNNSVGAKGSIEM